MLKAHSREDLIAQVAAWRALGERIVFTNGVFDLLHVGHARYLADAKKLGDRLVVGLNSDASVRRLKGDERPFVTEEDRAELLLHLAAVDAVTIFEEETPVVLIEALRPDIHVKGGDYDVEQLPETPVVRAYGGEVRILRFVEGRSTTNLADRIRRS